MGLGRALGSNALVIAVKPKVNANPISTGAGSWQHRGNERYMPYCHNHLLKIDASGRCVGTAFPGRP